MPQIDTRMLAFAALVIGLGASNSVAFDPEAVERLKSEKVCPDCDLSEVSLPGGYLPAVVLTNANLANANLKEGNLNSADLSGANLAGADLSGTRLAYVNLSAADLSDEACLGHGPSPVLEGSRAPKLYTEPPRLDWSAAISCFKMGRTGVSTRADRAVTGGWHHPSSVTVDFAPETLPEQR